MISFNGGQIKVSPSAVLHRVEILFNVAGFKAGGLSHKFSPIGFVHRVTPF
jgi:hypothetical protein